MSEALKREALMRDHRQHLRATLERVREIDASGRVLVSTSP